MNPAPPRVSRVSAAVAKASVVHPDVVVIDIHLAGQRDGIEGAMILKQMCGTEVVFVSGETDSGVLERAKALEPVAFLSKPCTPRDLLCAMQKAVGPEQTPRICHWT